MSENTQKRSRSQTLYFAIAVGSAVLYSLYDRFANSDKNDTKNGSSSTKNKKRNSLNSNNRCEAKEIDHSVSNVRYSALSESMYVSPKSMYFEQNSNGSTRRWDLIESFNVVCGLAYDVQKDSFLFVKQFRPAVYHSHNRAGTYNKLSALYPKEQIGVTIELCAGIMDKADLSAKETMKEEFYEECGYDVPLSKIEEIATYRASTGVIGNHTIVFMAFLNDSMKVHCGGGDENENIELVWVPLNESKRFIMDKDKDIPPGLKFALFWFYDRYPELCKNVKSPDLSVETSNSDTNSAAVVSGVLNGTTWNNNSVVNSKNAVGSVQKPGGSYAGGSGSLYRGGNGDKAMRMNRIVTNQRDISQ